MTERRDPKPIVKTFSATRHDERVRLGDLATDWIQRQHWDGSPDVTCLQSSDQSYHCLSIVVVGVVYTRVTP